MRRLHDFPPGALVCTLSLLLVGYGTNVATPFLVTYRERLDLGDSATMAIFTVYVAGIIGSLLLAGPLSDRYGRRAVSVPFVTLSGVASIVLIFGRDEFYLLLLGRFMLGAVSGGVLGVGAAWLQELRGHGNEQRSALLSTVVTYAGFGLGLPISAAFEWLDLAPLVLPFAIHAGLAFAFAPILARVPETVSARAEARPSLRPRLGVPAGARRVFWFVVVPAAIWIFSFPSTSFALFPVLVSDAIPGYDVQVAAAAGSLTAWSALLARPTINRLGPQPALLAGLALGTIGYVLGSLSFSTDAWALVLPAAVLLGAASGTITAASIGILAGVADAGTRGSLNSTVFLLAYPGMAMPILITELAAAASMSAALLAVTATAALATAYAAIARRAWGAPPSAKQQMARVL